MGWLLPIARPQQSRLVARRKVVPKFDEGLKSALCSPWQHGWKTRWLVLMPTTMSIVFGPFGDLNRLYFESDLQMRAARLSSTVIRRSHALYPARSGGRIFYNSDDLAAISQRQSLRGLEPEPLLPRFRLELYLHPTVRERAHL